MGKEVEQDKWWKMMMNGGPRFMATWREKEERADELRQKKGERQNKRTRPHCARYDSETNEAL